MKEKIKTPCNNPTCEVIKKGSKCPVDYDCEVYKVVLGTVKVPFELTQEWIDSVVCTAFDYGYGGCEYWIDDYEGSTPRREVGADFHHGVVSRGGHIGLKHENVQKKKVEGIVPANYVTKFDLKMFKKGVEKYIAFKIENGREFSLDAGNIDSTEADLIVQFGVFGEIIFS